MEEDIGVKAPVTRLRRRLSVEQSDDVKSPSAPSTPTKKRVGRLAAKPQLDLIKENAEVSSQKRTTRKVSRDIAEPPEDKPVTPSRRSTRIKSNTSIASETTQPFDSPRAKRATRRNSQVGSDNEASVTPARQTRKPRRDSASSIESQAEVAPVTKSTKQITEDVIVEEPEFDLRKTTSDADISLNANDKNNSPKTPRKSLRLMEKTIRKSTSPKCENNAFKNQNNGTNHGNKSSGSEKSTPEKTITSLENLTDITNSKENKLSESTLNLIKDLETEPIKKTNNLNKSTSAMENSSNFHNKRHRTKSWTTISITQSMNSDFYSDNETKKKKIVQNNDNNSSNFQNFLNKVGSGDCQNTSISFDKTNSMQEEKLDTQINSPTKKKKRDSETSVTQSSGKEILTPNKSKHINNMSIEMFKTEDQNINKKNIEKLDVYENSEVNITETQLFEKPPSSVIKTMVFIEDSDSNTDSIGKTNKIIDENDQCVPVVEHQFENQEKVILNKTEQNIDLDEKVQHGLLNDTYDTIRKLSSGYNSITKQTNNDSCEPMDIDVTIPDNASVTNIQNDFSKLQNEELEYQRKSRSQCISDDIKDKSINKSKRKSTPHSISQDLEKRENENKSTLILSQIKDLSSTEDSASKSSKNFNDEYLLKSTNVPKIIKEKDDKRNISPNETTQTPLKQKNIKKLGIQTSTPVVACNDKIKKENIKDNSKCKGKGSIISKTLENSSSSEEDTEESSKMKNIFIDEAEEASDDYESGDSRDEDEIEYERQNEILHKGETLSSDSYFSNDSDYEKDSFIVSSDPEDMDLLSGTGDDLSMSDNELTMTAKSKKKYNERKMKEQKKASREIYEARHNLNVSDKSSNAGTPKYKKNRRRLNSSASTSDDNFANNSKASDYEKLNSSHEIDSVKSNLDETLSKEKKKKNRLSHSFTEDVLNEKEITASGDKSTIEKEDPLSGSIKLELKTPQKNLNISTVNFIIKDDIEHINLDENTTISKTNESVDPLLATVSENEKSLSENEEIKQSYDSLLNDLNKNKKIKIHDISLNINKKPKKTANKSIIDQLNLTQIKTKVSNKTITKEKNVTVDEDTSSDSIDLKLLFSENSDSSVEKDSVNKQKKEIESVENFIPLKRTEGKTNIRESMVDEKEVDTSIMKTPNSGKKNSSESLKIGETPNQMMLDGSIIKTPGSGKKKSSKIGQMGTENTEYKEKLFDDTVEKLNESLNKSHKKSKKNKDNNISVTCEPEPNNEGNECDTESLFVDTVEKLNESVNRSHKKSKKNKDNNISVTCKPELNNEGNECDTDALFVDTTEKLNESLNKSHKKNKKKKDNNISVTYEPEPNNNGNECDTETLFVDTTEKLNESVNISHKKNKKKKDNISVTCEPETNNEEHECDTDTLFVDTAKKLNESPNKRHKKTKKQKETHMFITCEPEANNENAEDKAENTSLIKTPSSGKKKSLEHSKIEQAGNEHENKEKLFDDTLEKLNESVNKSHKKSKKKKDNNMSVTCEPEPNNEGNECDTETLFVDTTEKLNKSNNENGINFNNNSDINELAKEKASNSFLITTPGSTKKKSSEPLNIKQRVNTTATEKSLESTKNENTSGISKDNTLQNKKEENVPQVIIADNDTLFNRKRKFSTHLTPEKNPAKGEENISLLNGGQKKKRKVSHNYQDSNMQNSNSKIDKKSTQEVLSKQEAIYSGSKNKHLQKQENIQATSNEPENMKKNKKRKGRDGADGTKKAKIFKEDIPNKIHIPRLPDAVLNQLEDKPKKEMLKIKKPKVISTSNFIVEEKILKNKPSNYLEQSVYLNDSPVLKKQKEHIKKPKVLPFIPTASTSINGFTTNFKINVIPQETQFVAQSSNTVNFKNNNLYKSIKKLGTYDLYKRNRNIKMSKF